MNFKASHLKIKMKENNYKNFMDDTMETKKYGIMLGFIENAIFLKGAHCTNEHKHKILELNTK